MSRIPPLPRLLARLADLYRRSDALDRLADELDAEIEIASGPVLRHCDIHAVDALHWGAEVWLVARNSKGKACSLSLVPCRDPNSIGAEATADEEADEEAALHAAAEEALGPLEDDDEARIAAFVKRHPSDSEAADESESN